MNLLEKIELGGGSFCLVDIETTGFSSAYEEITEIAAIRVDSNFKVLAEISCLIKVTKRVPWHITQITGITDGLLAAHGKPLLDSLGEVHDFLNGQLSFAHNARFDSGFLNTAARREGLVIRFPLECSIPIFKRLLPKFTGYGLPALVSKLQVDGGVAHRALADCLVLCECLKRAHLRIPIVTKD